MNIDFTEKEIAHLKAAFEAWTRECHITYIKYNIEAVNTMKIHVSILEKLVNSLTEIQ